MKAETCPHDEWMAANADELRKHAGKYVAIHLERGIVASGETLGSVVETVDGLGLRDKVLVHFVLNYAPGGAGWMYGEGREDG